MEKEKVEKIIKKMTKDIDKNITLIESEFKNMEYVDYENQSLLHIFVSELYDNNKCLLAIESLLKAGLNPNLCDDFSYNFIQNALYTGYNETFILNIIKLALKNGLDVNHQDSDLDTIVHTAIYSDNYHGKIINIYKLLCDNGFDSNITDHLGKNILETMIKENKFSKNDILEFENEYKKQMNSISDDIKAKRKKVNTLSDKEISEIEKYGTLLNNKEYINTPAIGRDNEMKKIIVTLALEKSTPIIVGESGVGKTALVDQLVYMIKTDNVPSFLNNQLILEMDPASIVAGCKYVGTFEEKMNSVINICKKYNIILFIDEVHTIFGVGSAEGKNNDMASILKRQIDRNNLKVIGTTTKEEYEKYFSSSALKRRFECIEVKEPSLDILYQIIDKVICDNCNNTGYYFENANLKSDIIRIVIEATKEKHRVYNDKMNNPALAISIIDKSFAFAKYYDSSFIDQTHFIESISCCDRIYESVKNNAIPKLEMLSTKKYEQASKILKIDFYKSRKR